MKRIIVSSLAIFPLLPLSGREILWSIMAWQMEPNRGRFIILKQFIYYGKTWNGEKYLFAYAIWMPPQFLPFFPRDQSCQMSTFFSFSYEGQISDKEMACRARPIIMPQFQIFTYCWNVFVYHICPKHFIFLWFMSSLGVPIVCCQFEQINVLPFQLLPE